MVGNTSGYFRCGVCDANTDSNRKVNHESVIYWFLLHCIRFQLIDNLRPTRHFDNRTAVLLKLRSRRDGITLPKRRAGRFKGQHNNSTKIQSKTPTFHISSEKHSGVKYIHTAGCACPVASSKLLCWKPLSPLLVVGCQLLSLCSIRWCSWSH